MARYVALLRAVNVAGHARVRTADAARLFASAGALDVASFGHAGNFLFRTRSSAAGIAKRVAAAIRARHGEEPVIVLRSAAAFVELAGVQPFARFDTAPNDKLYVTFLARSPRVEQPLPVASAPERLTILERRGRDVLLVSGPKPNGFYGFPNAFVETTFGVRGTTRNWSTVVRLAKLLAAS